jgi:hypothetical protein
MSGKECSREGIVELTTVFALNSFDGAAKLCRDNGKKIDRVKNVLDLTRKGNNYV